MKYIVFYVHRTGLLSYFFDPICSFLSKDYKIIILHLNKRNGYQFEPVSSPLYETIDLSDMSIAKVKKMLVEINPVVFISPGFISIYELLMLRIAKTIGIKTVFLEHGLYSKETAALPFGKLIYRFGSTVRKNLFFLRKYFEFARLSGDFNREISVFWRCFRKKEYYLSKFDKALFFAEYGRTQIGDLFRYDEKDVDYICYPLAKTDAEYEEYKEISRQPLTMEKKATFIHQPFILDGLAQWRYEDERDYFVGISNMLKEYGYNLSIQLHPRSDYATYQRLFDGSGIELIMGMERSDFKRYSLVLGHYSTALLYPIFFKIPVMLVDYPGVCKVEDSVFYPISCSLPITNPSALMEKYDDFCKEYMGVGICSFENIAKILVKTITNLTE